MQFHNQTKTISTNTYLNYSNRGSLTLLKDQNSNRDGEIYVAYVNKCFFFFPKQTDFPPIPKHLVGSTHTSSLSIINQKSRIRGSLHHQTLFLQSFLYLHRLRLLLEECLTKAQRSVPKLSRVPKKQSPLILTCRGAYTVLGLDKSPFFNLITTYHTRYLSYKYNSLH